MAEKKKASSIEKLTAMVVEMLEKPKIFIFGDILALPSVKRLQSHVEFKRYYNTLELFTYGNFPRYMELKDSTEYVELTPAMIKKLRYLTIIDLAGKGPSISYETLMEHLKINTARELEDLLIEAMFSGVIEGCMQQALNVLSVSNSAPRDAGQQPQTPSKRVLEKTDKAVDCEPIVKKRRLEG